MDKVEARNLRKALEKVGVEAVGYLTQILAQNDKRATGNLIQSLDFKVLEDVNGLMLAIIADDYFKYVDEGRRPGKPPPVKPIISWMKSKGIVIKNMSAEKGAFVISRSIGKKGIKPLNAMKGLIDNVLTKKEEILGMAAKEDVQALIDKIYFSPQK